VPQSRMPAIGVWVADTPNEYDSKGCYVLAATAA
jgi:hypothetical protein